MPVLLGAEIGATVALEIGTVTTLVFGANAAGNMVINSANFHGQISAAEIQFDG